MIDDCNISDFVFWKQIEYLFSLSEEENLRLPEILGQMRIVNKSLDAYMGPEIGWYSLQNWHGM